MISQRKNIFQIYSLFLFTLLLGACSNNNGEIRTTIKGSLPAFQGKTVTLSEFDINKAIPIDTVRIDEKGSFRFRFNRTDPGFYLVKIDNKNYLTLVLDQEKKVEVSSDVADLRNNYTVKGSPDSEIYHDFELNLEINRDKVDSLARTYNMYQRSTSFRSVKLELDKDYQEIFNDQRKASIDFLNKNCGSLASLLVINRRFGERKILTEEDDFKYYTLLDSCLSHKYDANKHLTEHKRKIGLFSEKRKIAEMTEQRLSIGNKVPDIELQGISGNNIKLSSLQGKMVILYFWASWDKTSRKANKMISDIIDKAGKGKPAVYAIGFESYKEPWENAINSDGLQNWVNVTDYLNMNSAARTMFNVPGQLPYFFLLDKEMVIRYKGADFEALNTSISQITQ